MVNYSIPLFSSLTEPKKNLILKIVKISIIIFVAFYLFGNFEPYYEGRDAYLYGIEARNLSEGTYSISNELLEKTGRWEFVGDNWLKTVHDSTVPRGAIGTPAIGAFFYLISGYYGLFYLGPIFGIALLIISERVSTKLFGKYVGLLTLLFLATNHLIFRSSILLNTDAVMAVFFILGTYYLVKFFKNTNETYILLASIFFVIATFVKLSAVVFLVVELLLVASYFILRIKNYGQKQIIKNQTHDSNPRLFVRKNIVKKALKVSTFLIIPWLFYFSFVLSLNNYYYGDPLVHYYTVETPGEILETGSVIQTFFVFEEKHFDQFKQYSKYLLPYQIPAIHSRASDNLNEFFGENWPGLVTPILLLSALAISLRDEDKRLEITVFVILIVALLWLLSGQATAERAAAGLPARYMIPVLVLSHMIFGFLILKFFGSKFREKITRTPRKILKFVFLLGLVLFFIMAFYFSPPIQTIKSEGFVFNNPVKYAEKYPLDLEGLSENSVIFAVHPEWVLDYGLTPFFPLWEKEISDDSIKLLKETISEGYEVFVFKKSTNPLEKPLLIELGTKHNLVLKDYSSSFCKLKINSGNSLEQSDKICLEENMDDSDNG